MGPGGSFVGYGGLMNGLTAGGTSAPQLPQPAQPSGGPMMPPGTGFGGQQGTTPGAGLQPQQGLSQGLQGLNLQQVPQGSYQGWMPQFNEPDPNVIKALEAARYAKQAGSAGATGAAMLGGAGTGIASAASPWLAGLGSALAAGGIAANPNLDSGTKAGLAAANAAPGAAPIAATALGASAASAAPVSAGLAMLAYGLTDYFTNPKISDPYKLVRMEEMKALPSRFQGLQQDIASATTPEQLWAAVGGGGFNAPGMSREDFLKAVTSDPSLLRAMTQNVHLDTGSLDQMATAAIQNQAQVIRALQMGGTPEAIFNAGRPDLAYRAHLAQQARAGVTQREQGMQQQLQSTHTPEQIQAAQSGSFDQAGGITPDMLAVLQGDPSGVALRQAEFLRDSEAQQLEAHRQAAEWARLNNSSG